MVMGVFVSSCSSTPEVEEFLSAESVNTHKNCPFEKTAAARFVHHPLVFRL